MISSAAQSGSFHWAVFMFTHQLHSSRANYKLDQICKVTVSTMFTNGFLSLSLWTDLHPFRLFSTILCSSQLYYLPTCPPDMLTQHYRALCWPEKGTLLGPSRIHHHASPKPHLFIYLFTLISDLWRCMHSIKELEKERLRKMRERLQRDGEAKNQWRKREGCNKRKRAIGRRRRDWDGGRYDGADKEAQKRDGGNKSSQATGAAQQVQKCRKKMKKIAGFLTRVKLREVFRECRCLVLMKYTYMNTISTEARTDLMFSQSFYFL